VDPIFVGGFRWEIMLLRLSGNANLQGALNGITGKVVPTGVSLGLQQRLCVGQPFERQLLKFSSVHFPKPA